MAAQGEREPGGLVMCNVLDPMARDGTSCNLNQRGSSTPFTEHGLCRQMEPHNGGAIAPRRGTEQAAINSAANGTTQGVGSQPPIQPEWARIMEMAKSIDKTWKEEGKRGVEMKKELEKKTSELQKLQNKERELQNELRVLKEEGMRQEKEISQLKETTRLKNEEQERVLKEERMRQEKEIGQLREITRLQSEEQERQWSERQKEERMRQEGEISQLKETMRLEKRDWGRKDRRGNKEE